MDQRNTVVAKKMTRKSLSKHFVFEKAGKKFMVTNKATLEKIDAPSDSVRSFM